MASKRGAWCAVEGCEEPKNAEMKDGLCTRHADEWRRSPEFRAATQDEKVVFWVQLRCEKEANKAIGKHRRRWVKRVSEPETEDGR